MTKGTLVIGIVCGEMSMATRTRCGKSLEGVRCLRMCDTEKELLLYNAYWLKSHGLSIPSSILYVLVSLIFREAEVT